MFPDIDVRAYEASAHDAAIPVIPVYESGYADWLREQPVRRRQWLDNLDFRAREATHCLVPGPEGELECVVFAVGNGEPEWAAGRLPALLPAGEYRFDASADPTGLMASAVAWGLGGYRYDRFKPRDRARAILVLDPSLEPEAVEIQVRAVFRVRDLINTPAGLMMPQDLARETESLAAVHGAQVSQIVGEDLLEQDYQLIHAVGRASEHAPRLIELRWGEPNHPLLALVGKGVCFDSGGLDLKPAAGMRLMKKDMGGAAHVLGLAGMIMETGLPVRVRVLIPAVENAVSGAAYRPGDVLTSRAGLHVEVDNTDAEGRLVLADALAEAVRESPDLVVDFATLTGAARVALGTEMAAVFTRSDSLAEGIQEASRQVADPVWRLPLHRPYRALIDSSVADIVNCTDSPFGGAITAALFLGEFVPDSTQWVHLDLMGWNLRERPGRPRGGEAMGLRAVFRYLTTRYGT